MGAAIGWAVICLAVFTTLTFGAGFFCDALPIFGWTISDVIRLLSNLKQEAVSEKESALLDFVLSNPLRLSRHVCPASGSVIHNWFQRVVPSVSYLPVDGSKQCLASIPDKFWADGPVDASTCGSDSDNRIELVVLLLSLGWVTVTTAVIVTVLVRGRRRRLMKTSTSVAGVNITPLGELYALPPDGVDDVDVVNGCQLLLLRRVSCFQ
jgi:hypothetical protein